MGFFYLFTLTFSFKLFFKKYVFTSFSVWKKESNGFFFFPLTAFNYIIAIIGALSTTPTLFSRHSAMFFRNL